MIKMSAKLMVYMKKAWYWILLASLIILGMAIYSSMGKKGELKKLLNERPKRKSTNYKMPEKPQIVDYVELYKSKIRKL